MQICCDNIQYIVGNCVIYCINNIRIVKVSIITASYNSAQTIGDTMRSVMIQTWSDIEYIVVDGASTDGTQDVIRQNEALFDGRLKWVSEQDGGIYDAMNKGIQMATGDVVGILNSDDYFTSSDVIERMVKAFDDPKVDAVFISFTTMNQISVCAITVRGPSVHYGSVSALCLLIRHSTAVERCLRRQASIKLIIR